MEYSFVIRTFDLVTLTNCYNEICGDEAQIKAQRKKARMLAVVFILAGLLSFLASVPLLRIIGFWMLIVGIGMLFLSRLKKHNQRRLDTAAKDTMIYFSENGFMVWEDGEQEQHSYADLTRLHEDTHCFILHMGRTSACYLPKADFVEGDAEAFAEFISQRSGLPVKSMKWKI